MAVGDGGVRVEVLMLPRLQRYRRDAGRNRPVLHLVDSCPRGVCQILRSAGVLTGAACRIRSGAQWSVGEMLVSCGHA